MKIIWTKALAYMLAVTMCFNVVNIPVYAQGSAVTEVFAEEETTSEAATTEEVASTEEATTDGNDGSTWDQVTTENVFEGENYKVTFTLTANWDAGYNANVKLENTGDSAIQNWYLGFDYNNSITNIWNAEISSNEGNEYVIKNVSWNQDIATGNCIEFGISGNHSFKGFPENYELIGISTESAEDDYTIQYIVDGDWGTGFYGSISLINNTDTALEDWVLEFDFDREITEIWNGVIEEYEDNHYVVRNAEYNSTISPGKSVSIGIKGCDGESGDEPINFVLYSYTAHNGTSMEIDTDGDGIVDGLENMFGSNYQMVDTDGDGLSDYQELYLTITDSLSYDTDGDGICDAHEDTDLDGLINIDEIYYGTNPSCADTDGDNMPDYDEVATHYSDPLNTDTDGDGLNDFDDVLLGFSPLLKDTDNNGVLDPDEKIDQTVTNDFLFDDGCGIVKVEVSMNINGNINKKVGINNVYEFDSLSREVVGLVGVPVEIRCNTSFDTATIRFTYDELALGDVREEDLAVLWYDETNGWYQILDEESIIDMQTNTVSYTTTHFSTYMLVDRAAWYAAWRENIDYRISGDGDSDIHQFDIAFVVDVSGSMSGSKINNAKTAIKSFINQLESSDEAAIITFHTTSTILSNFTGDILDLLNKVDSLKANGGTNVNNGLLKALEIFEKRESDKEKIIVLICDGDVNYVQSTIDRCIEDGIQIYAVNLQSSSAHVNLQKMADQTNGQYYYGASVNEITGILGIIQDDTINKIDPTDTDGDGLYDIYETAGIKLPNGKIIYTSPSLKDTDGDGLTDFDEVGLIYNVDDRYIGYCEYKEVKYFIMRSNPTKKDTDDDGVGDKDDPNPTFAEQVSKDLANIYSNLEYLNVDGLAGGRQNWWLDRINLNPQNIWEEYEDYILNSNYRMGTMGCGVIAMTDIELYMTQQNTGYSAPLQAIEYNQSTGLIEKDNYMKYAEYNRDYLYYLGDNTLNYLTGVLPASMEVGIEYYLEHNNHQYKNATWAPYCGGKSDTKVGIANKIETMISRNLPVAFAYVSFDDEIRLYKNLKSAETTNISDSRGTNGHYMTIIGYSKYLQDDGINYRYILKVVSWGEIFYIDYDEYADKLSYFSNILEIK